jgi:hypothetical protein
MLSSARAVIGFCVAGACISTGLLVFVPRPLAAGYSEARALAHRGSRPAAYPMTLVSGHGVVEPSGGREGIPRLSDLERLMEQVLVRRDENWKKLQQYVLDERETFFVVGPDGGRIYGQEVEYTWFVRDGWFVRSPLRSDGVAVSEADRRHFEDRFLQRERQRAGQTEDSAAAPGPQPHTADDPPLPGGGRDVLRQALEPRFVRAA